MTEVPLTPVRREIDDDERERAPGQFRVLTQNMFAHYFVQGSGNKEKRVLGLISCLATVKPPVDVVLIQEIFVGKIGISFGDNLVDKLVAQAKDIGFAFSAKGTPPPSLFGQNNGLLILSKFPITECAAYEFRNRSETVCAKGVLTATISVDGVPVHLITSHLDSRGPETKRMQLMEVRSHLPHLFDQETKTLANIILTGDLNVDALGNRGGPGEYETLMNVMSPGGELVDVSAGAHTVTCEEDNAHLDYILASPHLLPPDRHSSRKLEEFRVSDEVDAPTISDHWGISCTFYVPMEDLDKSPASIPTDVHVTSSPFLNRKVARESVLAWRQRTTYDVLSRDKWSGAKCMVVHDGVLYVIKKEIISLSTLSGCELGRTPVSKAWSSVKAATVLLAESNCEDFVDEPDRSLFVLCATNGLHKINVLSGQVVDIKGSSSLTSTGWQYASAFAAASDGSVYAFCKKLYHITNTFTGDYKSVGRKSFAHTEDAIIFRDVHNDQERCLAITAGGHVCEVDLDAGTMETLHVTPPLRPHTQFSGLFEMTDPISGHTRLFVFSTNWLYRIDLQGKDAHMTRICFSSWGKVSAVAVDEQYLNQTGRQRIFVSTDICLARVVLPEDLFEMHDSE